VTGLLKDGGMINDASDLDRTGMIAQSCPADVERTGNFQVSHSIGARMDNSQRPVTFTVKARFKNLQQNWQTKSIVCRIGGKVKFGTGAEAVERVLPGFEIVVPDDVDTLTAP
jgi:hypothetical protein